MSNSIRRGRPSVTGQVSPVFGTLAHQFGTKVIRTCGIWRIDVLAACEDGAHKAEDADLLFPRFTPGLQRLRLLLSHR